MKVAQAIARAMQAEGVDILFAYPVNPLIEAAAEENIRTVIVRQERVGLHMADAYSRVSSGDRIGVFCMQHGPGAENAFGGVAQAHSESVPILVIPAGYPRRLAHYYPNFNSTLNMQHITKWAEPLTMGKAIPEVLRRIFFQLRNGRPGPVLLEVPVDVFGEDVPDTWQYTPSFKAKSGPDPAAVAEAAAVLARAAHPVIYAGQGVHYSKAWDALKALAEEWNIPVTTSIEGKSAFPENHPLSLGSGGRANPRAVKTFLAEADVILGIGCSFALTGFGVPMPPGKTIIHATLDPMDLNKDVPAQYGLIGDAQLTLTALRTAMASADKAPALARNNGSAAHCVDQGDVARRMDAEADEQRDADQSVSRVVGAQQAGRQVEDDRHPRRRQSPRSDHAVLGSDHAPQLHRLGQDDAVGIRTWACDGCEARETRSLVHQRLGRRGDRLHRNGFRDLRARADSDLVDPVQQLLDGDRDSDHAGVASEVRLDRHFGSLCRHGESVRLLR